MFFFVPSKTSSSFGDLAFVCVCQLSVPFRHGERIGFSYLVSQKYTGDSAAIKVLRDSKIFNFNIKLATHRRLIPSHNKGQPPSYYIIAGFVFSAVSVPYLRSEVCYQIKIFCAFSLYMNALQISVKHFSFMHVCYFGAII